MSPAPRRSPGRPTRTPTWHPSPWGRTGHPSGSSRWGGWRGGRDEQTGDPSGRGNSYSPADPRHYHSTPLPHQALRRTGRVRYPPTRVDWPGQPFLPAAGTGILAPTAHRLRGTGEGNDERRHPEPTGRTRPPRPVRVPGRHPHLRGGRRPVPRRGGDAWAVPAIPVPGLAEGERRDIPVAAEAGSVLCGQVCRSGSGAAVRHAEVRFESDRYPGTASTFQAAYTDGEGRFEFPYPVAPGPPGRGRLGVPPGHPGGAAGTGCRRARTTDRADRVPDPPGRLRGPVRAQADWSGRLAAERAEAVNHLAAFGPAISRFSSFFSVSVLTFPPIAS
jgi:hypothetical protein